MAPLRHFVRFYDWIEALQEFARENLRPKSLTNRYISKFYRMVSLGSVQRKHRKACRSAAWIVAAVCALSGLFSTSAARSEVVPGDDFNANAQTAALTLQRWYNHRGLWDTTDWWNAANCVEALEEAIVANNGQSYLPVLDNTFDLNSGKSFLNEYYDDEGWWALAWIRAFDLTGQDRFLTMAKTIFSDMTGGWSDRCGGGIWWKKNNRYKNAIANELFLLVAVRLHQRTPGDEGPGSCLDWAQREWAWFKQSGMINSQNLINDGLNRDCQNNGRTTWTYNQGVILGGLADLYKTTGDTNYLNQAAAIADAAIHTLVDANGILKEPCESGDCHGGDVPQFKGIFIRNLAYLHDVAPRREYFDFLLRNAHSVWFNDRDSTNHLGLRWTGPFDRADAARHSSAMFAITAVAQPMTRQLPFAGGAGSATFNHSTGSASGTLAWTCNAADAPGFMLSGLCLESLPEGIHVAHFRMAASRPGKSARPLVRLDIRDSRDARILAARDVPWSSFADATQSRDFLLPFTNNAAGDPLELRVYWNAAANAPVVTISDVTVDGGLNWTAANLAHEIGRLDGRNTWTADPMRDRASGFLATGPRTRELPAGKCSAAFELKVDNFNWDTSVVATISVVETGAGKTVASRDLRRNEFATTLYQTFLLDFKAVSGKRYDFRTYWHYAPHAPCLTQRSLTVQATR
jgi:predicted alpha-1,6-mannanase (GH76 family)